MNIKMIVTDLDGTLVRSDLSVSNYTRDILRRCQAAGFKTVIATGRGHPEEVAPTELFDGIIANNGANIHGGDVNFSCCIPYEEARPLLLACTKRGFQITSQFDGMHYTNFNIALTWPHIRNFEIVDFAEHTLDSEKICMIVETAEDALFIEKHLADCMYLTIARDKLGMIMHRDATKSAALKELTRRWDISRDEIVAFGDDLNDIDMLKYSGTAIVMGNAVEQVKTVADYICDTNDNDGVAQWLEKNLLLHKDDTKVVI